MLPFEITDMDPDSSARAAELSTPHGVVRTPAFMPVGTAGTVKGMAAWELDSLAPICCCGPGSTGSAGSVGCTVSWGGPDRS